MKKITLFEKAINEKVNDLSTLGINGTMFWAYRRTQDSNNEFLNFDEVIWEKDIEEIAKALNENNISEFTISCNYSGLITTLVEFEKHGFKVRGTTTVNASYKDWNTGKLATIPAIRMWRA